MLQPESATYSNSNVGASNNLSEGVESIDAPNRGIVSTNEDSKNTRVYNTQNNNNINNNRPYNYNGAPLRGSARPKQSTNRRNDNIQGSYDRNKRPDSTPDSPMNRSPYTKGRHRNDQMNYQPNNSNNYNQGSPMIQAINISSPPSIHSSPSLSYQNAPMIQTDGGYSIAPNMPRSNLINEQGYYGNPMGIPGNHLAQDPRYTIPMAQQPVLVQLPQHQYYTSNPQMVPFNYHPNSGPMYAPNGQLSNLTNQQYIRPYDNRAQYFSNSAVYPGGNIQGTIHQHQSSAPMYTSGVIPGQIPSNIQLVGNHPQVSGPGGQYAYQQIPPNIEQREYVYQHNQPVLIASNSFMVPQNQIAIPSIIPNHPSQNLPNYQQANNFPIATSNTVNNSTTVATSSNSNSSSADVTAPKRKQLVVLDKEGKIFDHGRKPSSELPTNKSDGDNIKSDVVASKAIDIEKSTNNQDNETVASIENLTVESNSTDSALVNVILNDVIAETIVKTSLDIEKISSGIDMISRVEEEKIKTDENRMVLLTETTNVLNQAETIYSDEAESTEQTNLEKCTESATSTFEEKDETIVTQVISSSTFSEIPVYINPVVLQPSNENPSWRNNSSDRKSSSSPTFNNKTSKKSEKSKNEFKVGEELDAYTPTVIKPVEVLAEKPIERTPLSEPQVINTEINEEPENWEDTADLIQRGEKLLPSPPIGAVPTKIDAKIDTKVEHRSLRPMTNVSKLNQGFTVKSQSRLIYSRDDLFKIKALVSSTETPLERPSYLSMYSSIVSIDVNSGEQKINSSDKIRDDRNLNKPSQWTKVTQYNQPNNIANRPSSHNNENIQFSEPNDWKRDNAPNQLVNPVVNPKNNRNRGLAPPMPKKTITDPIEILTAEVRSILNKITPQTFEKLANNIKDMKITSSLLLDRLVSLIFEKAIYEQNFSNLYADLCYDLEKSISTWSFLHVVYNKDHNQYYWIKDCQFIDDTTLPLAGPFNSVKDCLNEITSDSPPVTRSIPYRLELVQVIVTSNVLIKIYKNLSNSSEEQYFAGYMLESDIDPNCLPEKLQRFSTIADAEKNAKKKNSVKSRLLTLCEIDFKQSSSKSEVDSALEEFKKNRKNMKPEDIQSEEQRIDELQGKWKRRMLGLIRFIGELFKKGMVSSTIITTCIEELFKDGNTVPNEQEIESLCKLIRTVGYTFCLKEKIDSTYMKIFDSCFHRMNELSKYRNLNSRLRFSLEEIIELRNNNWIERRQQEGPSKIDEIHKKAAEEEYLKNQNNINARYNTNRPVYNQLPVKNNFDHSINRTKSLSNEQIFRSNTDDSEKRLRNDTNHNNKQIANLGKTLVDDFLHTYNSVDAKDIINDSNGSVEFLNSTILYIFDKYVNTSNQDIQKRLLELLVILDNELIKAKQFIWQTVVSIENLRLLPDFLKDCIMAPELYGELIGVLMRINVASKTDLTEFVNSVKQENLDNENTIDVIDLAFNRLITSAIKYYNNVT